MPKAKTASKKRRVATKAIVRHRLLSLPAEIRTLIWEYVIGGTEPAKDKIDPTKTAFVDISTSDFKNHTRCIYTCRQIYNETHLMFYHRQQLLFPLNNTPESHLRLLHFASKINPRAHRFVGFETCWILNHTLGGIRHLTDEERSSFQTLWLQMASIGWTRRLFVRRRPDAFPKDWIDKVAAEHQRWGVHAYHHLVKRYVFRMLLRHVKTEYLRRPAVVALWVLIVKPDLGHTRQLLEVWIPGFDAVNDPARVVGSLLLEYPQFKFGMPMAPKEWDTKTHCKITIGVHVMLKILWNMRHWLARQALLWFDLIKSTPNALHAGIVAKRRKCERIYKRFQRDLEEKRKREAVHGFDASSTAIFALWPLLLCLALCFGTIIYEYTGPATSLLLWFGATVIGKSAALIALLGRYAQQAIV